jgi:Putative zincin peptidase
MKMKPEDLSINGYVLMDRMAYTELTLFVKTYLKKKTRSSILYRVIKIILYLLIFFFYAEYYISGNLKFFAFIHFLYGFPITLIILLPVHEYIHILAFKLLGAKQTSVSFNFNSLYFLAIADKFVLDRKEFLFVVLAPFITISLLLAILSFFVVKFWIPAVLGALFFHTLLCVADMALCSYLDLHKDKEVVTYDDKDNKAMYFYGKAKS